MCGISGELRLDGGEPDLALMGRMLQRLARRGPDHEGTWSDGPLLFGHRRLSVIDLHRAQTRAMISKRWRNKDLAALYFSALDIGLTQRDKLRFLRGYFQMPLRQILREEASLLAWLEGKASKLYERKQRYGDAL